MSDRCTRVTCGDVSLKLTLTAKQLAKPFDQAVLAPFLKAYSKKVGTTCTVDQVTCVKVDDVMLGDTTIAASVVLLTGETVDTEITLRAAAPQAPAKPAFEYNPFGAAKDGASARAPPPGGTKDFDEDDRSEVEKIKEARRAARMAKQNEEAERLAAMPEAAVAVGERVVVCGLQSEAGREMNGLHGTVLCWLEAKERWELQLDSHQPGKTVNVKPANLRPLPAEASKGPPADAPAPAPTEAPAPAPAPAASSSLLAQLSAASDEAARLEAEEASARATFAAIDFEDVEADDEAAEVAARATSLAGALGKLQAMLDEADLSELDDEARQAARAQRKAASARLEVLLPKARGLCSDIQAARKRLG